MFRLSGILAVGLVMVGMGWCSGDPPEGLFWAPRVLPPAPVPPGNPQSEAKIQLGKQLYFEKRLSFDNTVSCASCHDPKAGWADPRQFSEGVDHAKGGRNAPTVLNSAHYQFQFWDGRAGSLEKQALGPIQNPVEMKMTMPLALDRLQGIPGYVKAFQEVFGGAPSDETVAKAIAAFERTVISRNSPFDRYLAGDTAAMSPAAVRGMKLFNGKAPCSPCHTGPSFTDSKFHNLGIGAGATEPDVGRFKVTNNPQDYGAFKTPTLRSVALTAPYLHDGSERTLEAVVEFYNRGGNRNPNLAPLMLPLRLTQSEKSALVAFLEALTGEDLGITEPALPE
ncbi:MAG: cytochrome-c peroxidase [Armatimonadetes bacterium]|nr:cytochrome-c peroxidase [Armatimonadota bacterium]NDK16445.1 cytochrome-c peroxidase [Armatimonadota bacterium]PJB63694.1 MAG: cytochrome-c peroxidase [Armatimonadetes bacterium CG_4_9_14_3_um_filter_66_14]